MRAFQTIFRRKLDMTSDQPLSIGGKTIDEWDRLWVKVAAGLDNYQPKLRYGVGLYRVFYNGQIVALGTGTDKGGGLAKRLSDFRRPSPSGRNHYAGGRINANLARLEVEVLITGSDQNAREIGRQLKAPMMQRHRPAWNVTNPNSEGNGSTCPATASTAKPSGRTLGVPKDGGVDLLGVGQSPGHANL
jgi:hypothetical protein